MLKKYFKRDLAPSYRIWLYFSIGLLAASIPVGLAERFHSLISRSWVVELMFTMLVSTYRAATFALPVLCAILCLVHYYHTCHTDQAYLTFTLPLKREEIYASKFFSTMFWIVASTLVTSISNGIALLIGGSDSNSFFVLHELLSFAVGEGGHAVFRTVLFYALEILITAFIVLVIHKLIGHATSTRSRIVFGVAAYLIISSLSSVVLIAIIVLIGVFSVMFEAAFGAPTDLFFTALILLFTVILATVDAMLYVSNVNRFEKKLNLQ